MMPKNSSEAVRSILIGALALAGLLVDTEAANAGVGASSCPSNAIAVVPGSSIQEAVEGAADGAVFCLKSGIHRGQAIRPRPGQRFYGEDQTVLNGSQLLTGFRRDGDYWVVDSQLRRLRKHGECLPTAPHCNQPVTMFI